MEFTKPGYITKNSTPLLYSDSITFKLASNDKELFSNLLGLCGFSDGPVVCDISVKSPVPQTGAEFDAAGYILSHQTITLGFVFAGETWTVEGRVLDSGSNTGAMEPANQDWNFKGRVTGRIRTAV